jgi:uracil-DNA glycosylase family 4
MPLPILQSDPIPDFKYVGDIYMRLTHGGCRRCTLGFQPEINGCCVSRGNPDMRRMIIGEAPGKEEDSNRLPFTGPAGRLMDKIFASVGLDTNEDFYVTNVVKCRPYLPKGSGKENFTPKVEQQKLCRPYLEQEIQLINPKLIVLIGKVAVDNVLPDKKKESMGMLRGQVIRQNGIVYFPMIHPAAILHATGSDLEITYKEQTWDDIQKLKRLIQEENL